MTVQLIQTAQNHGLAKNTAAQPFHQLRVMEHPVHIRRFHGVGKGKGHDAIILAAIPQHSQCSTGLLPVLTEHIHQLIHLRKADQELIHLRRALLGHKIKLDILSLQNRFILRFPQIEPIMIDIVLRQRTDEIGNIPVAVNIFPNPRGADILQIGRQCQIYKLSLDRIAHRFLHLLFHFRRDGFLFLLALHPPEHNMVEMMDRARLSRLAIGGRI